MFVLRLYRLYHTEEGESRTGEYNFYNAPTCQDNFLAFLS